MLSLLITPFLGAVAFFVIVAISTKLTMQAQETKRPLTKCQ
jgi:hypothetical protein